MLWHNGAMPKITASVALFLLLSGCGLLSSFCDIPPLVVTDATLVEAAVDGRLSDGAVADSGRPDVVIQDTAARDSLSPDTAHPDTTLPDTAIPDTAIPDTAPLDAGIPADWLFPDFGGRLPLRLLNPTEEVLANFPIPISLDDSHLPLDALRPDRADLLFIRIENGIPVPLAHEIELDNSDCLLVWVKVPALAASPAMTHLWLYYGDPDAESVANSAAVWSDGFRGVWHMGGAATDTSLHDSSEFFTGHRNDATMPTSHAVASGAIGLARRFLTETNVEVQDHTSLHLTDDDQVTLEAWVKPAEIEVENRYVFDKTGNYLLAAMRGFSNCSGNNFCPQMVVWIDTSSPRDRGVSALSPLPTSRFTYLAGTYSAADQKLRIYVNGQMAAEKTATVDAGTFELQSSNDPLYLGRNFSGWLDELRVSAVRRSDAWIEAQHEAAKGHLVEYGAYQQIRDLP